MDGFNPSPRMLIVDLVTYVIVLATKIRATCARMRVRTM